MLKQGLADLLRDFSMFKGLGERRVDNFPLFRTSEGHWAIGLIDIEHDQDTFIPIKIGEDWHKDNLYVIRKQALCALIYFYPYHADLIRRVASHYLDEETIAKLPLEQAEVDGKRYLQAMVPGFLGYLTNRKEMTPEIKEIMIDELEKLVPRKVMCRRLAAPVQDNSKVRQAIASYIDDAFQVLKDRKAKKVPLSTHAFSQSVLHLYSSEFPNPPGPFEKLGSRFLELLEELGIIYHYCPGPSSETVIF